LQWRSEAAPRRTPQYNRIADSSSRFSGEFRGVFEFLRKTEAMQRPHARQEAANPNRADGDPSDGAARGAGGKLTMKHLLHGGVMAAAKTSRTCLRLLATRVFIANPRRVFDGLARRQRGDGRGSPFVLMGRWPVPASAAAHAGTLSRPVILRRPAPSPNRRARGKQVAERKASSEWAGTPSGVRPRARFICRPIHRPSRRRGASHNRHGFSKRGGKIGFGTRDFWDEVAKSNGRRRGRSQLGVAGSGARTLKREAGPTCGLRRSSRAPRRQRRS